MPCKLKKIRNSIDFTLGLMFHADDGRKKLARRLLFDKSANDEHERSILTKLKQQCGGQFTSKMEGMVTDLTVARDRSTPPHALSPPRAPRLPPPSRSRRRHRRGSCGGRSGGWGCRRERGCQRRGRRGWRGGGRRARRPPRRRGGACRGGS